MENRTSVEIKLTPPTDNSYTTVYHIATKHYSNYSKLVTTDVFSGGGSNGGVGLLKGLAFR